MDSLLTAILMFYAIAITILFGIAVYLVYKVDKQNKDLNNKLDEYAKWKKDISDKLDEYAKWKIGKYLDTAAEAIKKGEYLW